MNDNDNCINIKSVTVLLVYIFLFEHNYVGMCAQSHRFIMIRIVEIPLYSMKVIIVV